MREKESNNFSFIIDQLKFSFLTSKTVKSKIAFVVGNGRSGTHMMTRFLIRHDEIDDLKGGAENGFVFRPAVKLLRSAELNKIDVQKLCARFLKMRSLCVTDVYIDQTHIAHWFHFHGLEQLSPYYIMMIRNPLAVISSTVRHDGVASWLTSRDANCQFLGKDLYHGNYEDLDIPHRAALRWVANIEQFAKIRRNYDKSNLISYEDVSFDDEAVYSNIVDFLQLNNNLKKEKFLFRQESLSKYKAECMEASKLLEFISKHLCISRSDKEIMNIICGYGVK